jgi:5-methylcytosine-specific restriction endonuclease McrA
MDFPTENKTTMATKAMLVKAKGKRCQRCGNEHKLTIHHIKPVSEGGTNDLSNMALLCDTCHKKVHGVFRKTSNRERMISRNLKVCEAMIGHKLTPIGI